MVATEQQQREEAQKSALHLRQNQREFQQGFRKDLMQNGRNTEEDADIPGESQKKNFLALARRQGTNRIKEEVAGAVGATVLGAFSFGFLALLGRWIGKKWGIPGIIVVILCVLLFFLVMFIAIIKGICDTYTGSITDYFTTNICPSFK